MLLKPKCTHSGTEEFENKIIIEKWIKRTSNSSSVKDNSTKDSTNAIEFNVSKTEVLKHEPSSANGNANSFIKSCKPFTNKRPQHSLSNETDINFINTKVLKKSIPMKCNESQSISVETSTKHVLNRKCDSKLTNNKVTTVKYGTELINNSEKGKHLQHTPLNRELGLTVLNKDKITDIDSRCKNDLKHLFGEEKKTDVYATILDNYRYLITPKSWSVTEFINESKDRYVVFFNTHVVKESDTLISVIRKSLVIDKGAIINYSVHGLPVAIKGTILPKFLDSTKKLLSILHIFDKMQVCDGIGNDLNLTQTELIFKDNCRFWRHKYCKLVLIKSKRCLICTETRVLEFKKKAIISKTD